MTPTPAPFLSADARKRARCRLAVAVGTATLLWFYMFSPWTSGRPNFWLIMSGSAVILLTLAFLSSRPDALLSSRPSEARGEISCATDSATSGAISRSARVSIPLEMTGQNPEMNHFQIFHFSGNIWKCLFSRGSVYQLLGGIALAFALWGIFWIGDKVSSLLFHFARPEVDAVYAMKQGLPAWLIAVLLLVLIGPAEELFWRGYVQRTLGQLFAARFVPAAAQSAAADSPAPAAEPRARNAAFAVTAAIYALVHIWSFNFMLVMAALVAGLVWGLIYRLCPRALPALVISHALWDALVFVMLPI